MRRVNGNGHNADRRPPINLLEPIQNWPQELLPSLWTIHVVDGQNDHRFGIRFPDPLRGDQFREVPPGIEGITFIEVNETVGIRYLCCYLTRYQNAETKSGHKGTQEPGHAGHARKYRAN